MVTVIKLSFRYTEEDYVRGHRLHLSHLLQPKRDLAVSVVMLALGVYLWRTSDSRWLGPVLCFGSIVLPLMLLGACVLIPRWLFRREPKFRDPYTLVFSPEGIHFETAHINSDLQWSIYTRALVDAHSYVLYYGESTITVIPQRVFESAAQRAAFDELLAQHIPVTIRRPSAT